MSEAGPCQQRFLKQPWNLVAHPISRPGKSLVSLLDITVPKTEGIRPLVQEVGLGKDHSLSPKHTRSKADQHGLMPWLMLRERILVCLMPKMIALANSLTIITTQRKTTASHICTPKIDSTTLLLNKICQTSKAYLRQAMIVDEGRPSTTISSHSLGDKDSYRLRSLH